MRSRRCIHRYGIKHSDLEAWRILGCGCSLQLGCVATYKRRSLDVSPLTRAEAQSYKRRSTLCKGAPQRLTSRRTLVHSLVSEMIMLLSSLGALLKFKTARSSTYCLHQYVPTQFWHHACNGSGLIDYNHEQADAWIYATNIVSWAAQFKTTTPCHTAPFRDSIAEWVSHAYFLTLKQYRASIAEIPLRGGIAPQVRM